MRERIRMMIIDDDQDILLMMQTYFETNYQLFLTSSCLEALEKVQEFKPDIFIVDVMLPGMDGNTFIENIRAIPEFMQTPAFILSGKIATQDIQEGYRCGASIYLCKPFSPAQLEGCIMREIDKIDTQKEIILV